MRRVPAPLASLDPRGIIRRSTNERVAEDRTGRHAARIAHKLNEELEAFWHGLSRDGTGASANAYEAARRRARTLGIPFALQALLALFRRLCLLRRYLSLARFGQGMLRDGQVFPALPPCQPPHACVAR